MNATVGTCSHGQVRQDGALHVEEASGQRRLLVARVQRATGMWERMRGLLGYAGLGAGEGMWLDPCRSIHMVGMRFAIDVIFLDRSGYVVRVVRGVRPMSCAWGGRSAHSALEVRTGWLPPDVPAIGSRLVFVTSSL